MGIASVREFGSGNINDTYLVTLTGPGESRFVLQRINPTVFEQPQLVVKNMRVVSEHVRRRLDTEVFSSPLRWEIPQVLLTAEGFDHHVDSQGFVWRAMSFIAGTETFDTLQNDEHAQEVGRALGTFHRLIRDLSVERLAVTLEGFHVTPRYLRAYDAALHHTPAAKSAEENYVQKFVHRRRKGVTILEDAKASGKLRVSPMHGDPKVNNILLDACTHKAVAMVDLDTVMPGLLHCDIGDCLRSCCNPLGEETVHWERVSFDPDLCRIILKSYADQARGCFLPAELDFMVEAIRLIPFELGLRFFTDHLEGNVYFKVKYPGQNLVRALVQFRLSESIEERSEVLIKIVRELQ